MEREGCLARVLMAFECRALDSLGPLGGASWVVKRQHDSRGSITMYYQGSKDRLVVTGKRKEKTKDLDLARWTMELL